MQYFHCAVINSRAEAPPPRVQSAVCWFMAPWVPSNTPTRCEVDQLHSLCVFITAICHTGVSKEDLPKRKYY